MELQVRELLGTAAVDLQLTLVTGRAGLSRAVVGERVQKAGLAVAGFVPFVHTGRLQIVGMTEISYLNQLSAEERVTTLQPWMDVEPCALVVTKGLEPPAELVELCQTHDTPLLKTPQTSSVFIPRVQSWLEDRFAPRTAIHGVFMEVWGVGILLLGKSGIGKSECALDLLQRGHRLVADDMVDLKRRGTDVIYGTGTAMLRHHIEVRGLGILNVKDMFGITAVRARKRVELVIELVEWRDGEAYDRLGLDERSMTLLNLELPLLTVPVRPGRNMASIIEVAARNHALKSMGTNPAVRLQQRISQEIARGRASTIIGSDDVE